MRAGYSRSGRHGALTARMLELLERDSILRTAQGILAETAPRTNTLSGTNMVTGTANFTAIVLRAGTLVSNISIALVTAGAAVTLSKVGIYSKAGLQLAVSADQGTNWQSVGIKTIAVTTPYVVPVTDVYYVCALAVFTSTAPAIIRSGASSTNIAFNAAVGSGLLPYGVEVSLADMPSPATIVVGSATPIAIWAAIT